MPASGSWNISGTDNTSPSSTNTPVSSTTAVSPNGTGTPNRRIIQAKPATVKIFPGTYFPIWAIQATAEITRQGGGG